MEIIVGPVAASENNVIGNKNDLPWGRNLKDDLKRFKKITNGHTIVMGRKTFESIGKPLPNRINIVLTRNSDYNKVQGVKTAANIDEALNMAKNMGEEKVFLIGGESVFKKGLEVADKMYLTRVHATINGDTYFPEIPRGWQKTKSEFYPKDENNIYDTTFEIYVKG